MDRIDPGLADELFSIPLTPVEEQVIQAGELPRASRAPMWSSALVEAFYAMEEDLESEKKAMQKQWAKRKKHLELAVANTTGLHGEFQAVIGGSLKEIRGISLLALEGGEEKLDNNGVRKE